MSSIGDGARDAADKMQAGGKAAAKKWKTLDVIQTQNTTRKRSRKK